MTDIEYKIPCPTCKDAGRGDTYLVERTNRKSGHAFLGCPLWPECDYTQEIPEYIKMIQAGQPQLFTFDKENQDGND